MAGWFSKVEQWWARLSGLRQTLLGIAGAWVFGVLVEFFSARFGVAVSSGPVAMAMEYFREYILNGYVASALASGLIVGFWSYVAKGFRATAPALRALWPLGALVAAIFIVPDIIDWWSSRNDPHLFKLSDHVLTNMHTLKMPILDIEPADLAKLYRTSTSLAGAQFVKPYLGKWMAITGLVYDVAPPDNNVDLQVRLTGHATAAVLDFADENRGPIWRLQKDQRIKALCRLVTVDEDSVGLSDCTLIP